MNLVVIGKNEVLKQIVGLNNLSYKMNLFILVIEL